MSAIFDNTAYEMNVKILPEVCTSGKIKISQLMMLHQEIGEKHLNVFGTTSKEMREDQKLAFIFTKASILIHRLPSKNEEIVVRTWCSELKGVRFTRNYQTFDLNGSPLTEAKCEVTTIDLESRRIVRPTNIDRFDDFLYNNELENNCPAPQKIANFDNLYLAKSINATEETIDFNGHVNNTMYADFAISVLPDNVIKSNISKVDINFINEVMPHEIIDLYIAQTNQQCYVVSGKVGDKQSFLAQIEF